MTRCTRRARYDGRIRLTLKIRGSRQPVRREDINASFSFSLALDPLCSRRCEGVWESRCPCIHVYFHAALSIPSHKCQQSLSVPIRSISSNPSSPPSFPSLLLSIQVFWTENHIIMSQSSELLLREFLGLPIPPALHYRLDTYLDLKLTLGE